jgi:hypothetical protein
LLNFTGLVAWEEKQGIEKVFHMVDLLKMDLGMSIWHQVTNQNKVIEESIYHFGYQRRLVLPSLSQSFGIWEISSGPIIRDGDSWMGWQMVMPRSPGCVVVSVHLVGKCEYFLPNPI